MTTFHSSTGDAIVCDDGLHDVYYDGIRSSSGLPPASFNSPRKSTMSPRYPFATRRRHAFDAEPDHEAALKHLEHASNHVSAVQSGSSDFDSERFAGYLKGAMDCMRGGAEDEERRTSEEELTAEERHRRATGEDRRGARDSLPRGMRRSLDVGALFDVANVRGGR